MAASSLSEGEVAAVLTCTMYLATLANVSTTVAQRRERRGKIKLIADCLLEAPLALRPIVALYLSGQIRQPKLGVAYGQLRAVQASPVQQPNLLLGDVDALLEQISTTRGGGSTQKRLFLLRDLYARATEDEQRFLTRLLLGELRQGALEALVLEAVAQATQVSPSLVRRARMLAGDLDSVVRAAFTEGETGLLRFDITPLCPVLPMLAEPADDIAEALSTMGRAALDLKLDGARIQVHRLGSEVRVFARSLNEVTSSVPEVVELAQSLLADSFILDGEALSTDAQGRPLPFQDTMRRFGRKLDVANLRKELPLSPFFFDCLYVRGKSLLDLSTENRIAALRELVPEHACVPRLVTSEAKEAEAFFQNALDLGHEGVMVKALDAPYAAGSRGASWLKVKRAHTLDLVVLAAEWGSGRRHGFLSNLHLGAFDPESDSFVMLGKTFKGLTDELLRSQTEALLAREVRRDGITVYVRPELVAEIAFNDVQVSPRYPGGVSLRFARVKRYRPDKSAHEADTIATVRALQRAQVSKEERTAAPEDTS